MMPLSTNWTALNSKIDSMVAAGNTNQAIGLAWAWQSRLRAQTALPNGAGAPIAGTTSTSRSSSCFRTASTPPTAGTALLRPPIDARQQLACANAKNAGMTVYTVLVMSGDSTVLQNCASDSNKYFALTNANQIVTTFRRMKQDMNNRLQAALANWSCAAAPAWLAEGGNIGRSAFPKATSTDRVPRRQDLLRARQCSDRAYFPEFLSFDFTRFSTRHLRTWAQQ